MSKVSQIISDWDFRDLKNLNAVMELDESTSVEEIGEKIKWWYHSKTYNTAVNMATKLGNLVSEKQNEEVTKEEPEWHDQTAAL